MTTKTWTAPGQTAWTLPANLDVRTPLTVTVVGAGGGGSTDGGDGGLVVGTLDIHTLVAGTSQIWIGVGGAGGSPTDRASGGQNAGDGGVNGGGDGGYTRVGNTQAGYGGGGASDIRVGGSGFGSRKVVAGGGGGAGRFLRSAARGGAGGLSGQVGASPHAGGGGGGGTQSAGGAHGVPFGSTGGDNATNGSAIGNGGSGGFSSLTAVNGGGGGGGGYFGGGGGGAANNDTSGGGGGGSSYVGGLASTTSVITGGGANGGTSGWVSVAYNAIPNQPSLSSPANSSRVPTNTTTPVTWAFSDPDSGDVQGSADVRWRVGTGAWITITGAATSLGRYTFASGTFTSYAGQSVEWQVRTSDSHNAMGPWSASWFFTPTAPPTAPTFTAPLLTGLASANPEFTFNGPDGIIDTQARVVNDASGSPGTAVSVTTTNLGSGDGAVTDQLVVVGTPATAYTNGASYHVQVRYARYSGVWSDWADSGPLVADINSPLQPTLALYAFEQTASVRIDITNPGGDPFPPIYNDVYRTPLYGDAREIRVATQVPLNSSYTDWRVGLHRAYRYRAVAITGDGAFTSSE